MSLASYQAALLRAEELVTNGRRKERLDMTLYHIYTNRIVYLYRMVKRASSMIIDHRYLYGSETIFFIFTNWILLRLVINMHEPFREVCVRIAQSLDN